MKLLEELKYEPPDQEVVTKQQPSVATPEEKEDTYVETVVDLINKYDLIALMCDYLKGLVDENMKGVSVSFEPTEYPSVYMALKRRFPTATEYAVTYEQYKTLCDLRMDLVCRGEY